LPEHSCDWSINKDSDRNTIRNEVIKKFLQENPGKGNKNLTSKYTYYVETLNNGKRIFLTRPAVLNKGFDFIIHLENGNFKHISKKRKRTYYNDIPSLDNILDDLEEKKKEDLEKYTLLFQLIENVYNCKDPNNVLKNDIKKKLIFQSGCSVEIILKIIKWFFIEQDIRYWNWSGRNKFFNRIKEI